MNPATTYRKQQNINWNRIDMLLLLYRETERSLRCGIDALHAADQAGFALSQVRTLRLLLAIIDGVDQHQDSLTGNIYQLCLFIFQQVSRENLDGLENGLRVLITLKEGFEAIEEEARKLEADGEIPPLDFDLDGILTVG